MTALSSPVELPVSRHSLVEFPMTANINDPTSWDVLSSDGNLSRLNSKLTSVSEVTGHAATVRSRPPSRGQHSTRAKDSPAIENLPQELEAQPMSYFPPRQSSAHGVVKEHGEKRNLAEVRTDTGHVTQTSDDYTESTKSTSTTGTTSLQEKQIYSLPEPTMIRDEHVGSPVLSSARSATNSVKKSAVPTSKYKKKPPASLRSSVRRKSAVESPLASPMSSYTHLIQSPLNTDVPLPTELPADFSSIPTPTSPSDGQPRQGQAPLQHTKSTASVRKARALHSHPSIPSLRSADAGSPQIPHPSPSLSTARSRKSVDNVRNRPSLYELQQPSPAPNTPLPELPPGVPPLSRPASRDMPPPPMPPPDAHVRPGTSHGTTAPALRRQDTNPPVHAEMASFMASSSKVIFRRFHDVHIRLLLTLQDEISTLERELAEIEKEEHAMDGDREARRVHILGALRRSLAEYDHLFSNWNLMQASTADENTRRELEQHLKQPASGNPMSPGAKDDLRWLQTHSNDLSCIDLNPQRGADHVPADTAQTDVEPLLAEKKEEVQVPVKPSAPPRTTGGGRGFSALFASCAGKRK